MYTHNNATKAQHYLHELFERQVEVLPHHPAIIYENEQTSYLQLDQRSNQLAQRLRRMGLGVGKYVAILLERNDFAYTAMLAILKVGAAYVPLDPEYPTERINFILQDCGVDLLITTQSLSSQHAALACEIFAMDQEFKNLSAEPIAKINPTEINLSTEDICYVIYTSGSTGKPKGVEIKHLSVCNYVHQVKKVYGLQSSDRVYQGFSIAFDASVEEIWTTLSSGATLIATNDKTIRSGAGLVDFLNQQQVSFLSTVPTLLAMLEPPLPHLKLLVLGGEVFHQDLVNRWSRPDLKIINTYGPTEATVITTYQECHPSKPVTIGNPLPNCEVYILNAEMQPVGINEEGELYIGGICLSRGYVNRPDLNQTKFVFHPGLNNKRLYRTGDLARRLENGEIQFVGRLDGQIKLRGFRIELDEIEAVIMDYPGIRKAVVAVWPQSSGVELLVGYLIPTNSGTFQQDNLPKFLHSRLAAYMVPTLFEIVEKFPLLPSGKVDRKNLPEPKINAKPATKNYIPARTAIENKIAIVWEKLFNCKQISVDSHFFYDLGGHSLLAAKAVSLLREDPALQNTSMVDIYKNPTIEKLALKIEENIVQEKAAASVNHKREETNFGKEKPSSLTYYLCGFFQLIGCFLQVAIESWEYFLIILVMSYTLNHYPIFSLQTLGIFAILVLLLPFTLVVFSIIVKWVLLGRVKPGHHKLWGAYYLRWWFVERVQKAIAPIATIMGSPLMNLYCRLMGAKIGKNCYIATTHLSTFDLLTIGDDTSINQDATLLGYIVENGLLKIGYITLGNRCFVGTRSVLNINTTIEDDGILENLSMLPSDTSIPKGQHYYGSPARPMPNPNRTNKNKQSIEKNGLGKDIAYGVLHYLGLMMIIGIYAAAFIPGIALIDYFYQHDGILGAIFIAAPAGGLLFMICICASTVISKKLLIGKMRPGVYPIKSFYYVKMWIVDHLMGLPEMEVMVESLYFPPFMRLLGAKVGKRVEMADLPHISPDLFTIKDESFTTGGVLVGAPRVYLGSATYMPVVINKRTFVGSTAVLPPGVELGSHCLIGGMSIAPTNGDAAKSNTAWLGSPPLFLPRREIVTSFSEDVIFNPPRSLYIARLVIEFFRIILPATFYFFIIVGFFTSLDYLSAHYSTKEIFLLFPFVDIAIMLILTGFAIVIKWILMGKYTPVMKPLWSVFIWKSDLLERLHNVFLGHLIFNHLLGTPFMAFFLRLLGAKIGKRVFIDSASGFAEYDLVDIGDDTVLNFECVMLTHLFEDRVFKTDKIKINNNCNVGCVSELMYDTVMEENSALGCLSLLMKGETLPKNSCWQGLPSQKIQINNESPADSLEPSNEWASQNVTDSNTI